MLRNAGTTPLSAEAARELRDALGRRQKELPPRWLATLDASTLENGAEPASGHTLEGVERELGLAMLRDRLGGIQPRAVVCIGPSASGANAALVESLCGRGSVGAVVTTEIDPALATAMLTRITPRGIRTAPTSAAIRCDCTAELPLPGALPRPRVYLALGNVLGSTTAVGAVRMLRHMRTTMRPGDAIILGLAAKRDVADASLDAHELDAAASRHFRALDLLNSITGGGLELERFDFRPSFDAENSRVEIHLVARKAFQAAIPGVLDVRFRKGESIRTSVSCAFDRSRVSAMMTGVGLTLHEWTTDPESRFVVALASPAV
jgi:L-histidine N-alpha-methyltransferase